MSKLELYRSHVAALEAVRATFVVMYGEEKWREFSESVSVDIEVQFISESDQRSIHASPVVNRVLKLSFFHHEWDQEVFFMVKCYDATALVVETQGLKEPRLGGYKGPFRFEIISSENQRLLELPPVLPHGALGRIRKQHIRIRDAS